MKKVSPLGRSNPAGLAKRVSVSWPTLVAVVGEPAVMALMVPSVPTVIDVVSVGKDIVRG